MTRLNHMVLRWFVVYAVVELAAVIALAWAIGLGWTLLLLLATFVIGVALAGSQVKRARGALTDSALIVLGALLVVIPGIVTSAVGLLLLLPPTRAAARLVLAAVAAKRIVTRRPDYIDGEVVDVVDVEAPTLPRHPSN